MTIYFIISLIGIVVVGFIGRILEVKKIDESIDFSDEYFEKFVEFTNKVFKIGKFNETNNQEYAWLVAKSNQMQSILSYDGIVTYQQFGLQHNNILILSSFLSDLLQIKNQSIFVDGELLATKAEWYQNAHISRRETLSILREKTRKAMANPFKCLSNGFRIILSLPIKILTDIGLLHEQTNERITHSRLFIFIGGLFSLISVLSAIVTIFVGWEDFIKKIINLF